MVPFGALFAYWITTGGDPQLAEDQKRAIGYAMLTFTGVLFAPWIAVGAMLKQRDAFARDQALAFELERSELERKALDARLRLLQAQVEPHFCSTPWPMCRRWWMRAHRRHRECWKAWLPTSAPRCLA